MNIDQTLEQLAHLQYPRQVDVTDRVMERISGQCSVTSDQKAAQPRVIPLTTGHSRGQLFRRIGIVAVAASLALVVINVATVYTRSYDEEGMGSMIAQLNDYSSWNTIEEVAVNPYEYLYEE